METKKVFVLADAVAYAEDGIVSKEFLKSSNGGITLFAFDKGQRLSEHSAPFDAVVQILDGEAEVLIDGEPFHPKAGETIILPANHPHALNALQPFKMMLTMIR